MNMGAWSRQLAFALCAVLPLVSVSAQELPAGGDGLLLSSMLEPLVESRDADGALRFDIVQGQSAAQVEQFVYSVQFTNATGAAAEGVRITSPVPPGLCYVADSAVGPGSTTLFSVDGGLTFGLPDELMVPDGNSGFRRAEAADYTDVRWILQSPLDARMTGFVRFRAVRR
jgi:uncharacterized repeat protein (TIGR01451 family)